MNNSPMEIAKEMVRLGFHPKGVLVDAMEGWTDCFADAIENLSGLERKVFVAMQQIAKSQAREEDIR
jgi:hypothetical protein